MTRPAITPPPRAPSLADEGRRIAAERGLPATTPGDIVWALTVDAAHTYAALPGDGPRGYPSRSAMPDPLRTPWELFGVERERITDRITVDTVVRLVPDARAIDRAQEVRALWTPEAVSAVVTRPQQAVQALWLYAAGVPPHRVRAAVGVPKTSLMRWREKCCAAVGRLVA